MSQKKTKNEAENNTQNIEKEEIENRKKRFDKRKRNRNTIKKSLMEQMEEKSLIEPHFTDLIEDYMALWDIKSELIHDINIKGVSVIYKNGENQWGYKKNDSIPELNKVNGQMLKILDSLGLKAAPEKSDKNDFDL